VEPPAPLTTHEFSQVRPIDIFHGEVIVSSQLSASQNWHDVGVIEPGHRLDFLQELPAAFLTDEHLRTNHLDGNDKALFMMARLEDLAQSSLSQLIDHLIGPDHQLTTVAGQKLVDLIDREPAFLDQALGKRTGIARRASGSCDNCASWSADSKQSLRMVSSNLLDEAIAKVGWCAISPVTRRDNTSSPEIRNARMTSARIVSPTHKRGPQVLLTC